MVYLENDQAPYGLSPPGAWLAFSLAYFFRTGDAYGLPVFDSGVAFHHHLTALVTLDS